MSRTDAHAPFRVRLARGELAARPVHACADRDCDLPDRPPARWYPGCAPTHCHWEFHYTGVGVCACQMCHGGADNRAENRRRRRRSKVYLAAGVHNDRMRDELP